MGRIVAIAGGELETTHTINRYLVALAGKERANLLFVGTASHDDEAYIAAIHREFERFGCAVRELCLTTERNTEHEVDELLNQADILYVGGGDTAFMLDIWKRHGLDHKLKDIYLKDQAVLSGISAGAMCWFNCGHSDSPVFRKNDTVGYGWIEGLLDLHSFAFCPHYNERAESFDRMIREKPIPGIALGENVAFVEESGRIHYIASNASSEAYVIRFAGGRLEKQKQKVIAL